VLGEITLVIAGTTTSTRWDEAEVRRALEQSLQAGASLSDVAREVAALSNWPRREVYQLALRVSRPVE